MSKLELLRAGYYLFTKINSNTEVWTNKRLNKTLKLSMGINDEILKISLLGNNAKNKLLNSVKAINYHYLCEI